MINGKIPHKKILVLEPHIDDLEIGCSILMENLEENTEITVMTFCSGTSKENTVARMLKRTQNIEFWEKEYNVKINHIVLFDTRTLYPEDTMLQMKNVNDHIGKITDILGFTIYEFNLVLFPQKDLHPDHCIVNLIGNILTRKLETDVWEYIIQNSFQEFDEENMPKWNIFIESIYDPSLFKFLEVCHFKTEKSTSHHLITCQKSLNAKIGDRFRMIKSYYGGHKIRKAGVVNE